jgi:hypothetical protein
MGPRLPFHYDVLQYVYPQMNLNDETLLRGRIPLWNPYLGCCPDEIPNYLAASLRFLKSRPAPEPGVAFLSRRSFNGKFPQSGFLAFNESYTPGWHAWLDGAPVPLLRAYGLFMAVAVPEGTHQVEFRYEPASFRPGLFLSLLALAFTGMTAALYGVKAGLGWGVRAGSSAGAGVSAGG